MAFGFATSSRSDFVHHMHIMAPRLRCRKGKSGLEDRQIVHLGQGTPTHEIIQRINGKVGQRTPSWCPQIEHGIYRYPQTVFLGEGQEVEKVIYFTASLLNPEKSSRQSAFLNA